MSDEKHKQALFEAILARHTAERFGRPIPLTDENGYLAPLAPAETSPPSKALSVIEVLGALIPTEIAIVFLVLVVIAAFIFELFEF